MKKINISKKLKLFFLKLARAKASTLEISWGAAIGTFISVFPTFGFDKKAHVQLWGYKTNANKK